MINRSKQKRDLASTKLVESMWYVGFGKSADPLTVFGKFFKKGFAHVYMYAQMGDRVLVINPTRGGLVFMYLPMYGPEAPVCVHSYLKDLYLGTTVVPAKAFVAPSISIRKSPIPTCVEFARLTLGIDEFMLTPWQLHNYLIKHRLAGEPLWPCAEVQAMVK